MSIISSFFSEREEEEEANVCERCGYEEEHLGEVVLCFGCSDWICASCQSDKEHSIIQCVTCADSNAVPQRMIDFMRAHHSQARDD